MFLLVPAYPGSPGQKAVKRLCVCVCVCVCVRRTRTRARTLSCIHTKQVMTSSTAVAKFQTMQQNTFVQKPAVSL